VWEKVGVEKGMDKTNKYREGEKELERESEIKRQGWIEREI
jgi:hypothetical protein